MGYKNLYKTTTNRGEFNRAYKYHLEHNGKIRCSRCGYHSGENHHVKHYGGYRENGLRFPNWKLVSKQPKQWMKKSIEVIETYGCYRGRTYVEIKFST